MLSSFIFLDVFIYYVYGYILTHKHNKNVTYKMYKKTIICLMMCNLNMMLLV